MNSLSSIPLEAEPLISCVMPTYGRPDFVNEAVAMFLAQDYPNKELIVLNDCVGQEFIGDFPGVRIINCPQRFSTLGEKRNACIEMANGSLIAVWDDDDVYLPWRLSFSWGELKRWNTPFYRASHFWAYWGETELHDNQSVPSWLSHPNTLFTKKLWEDVGGYPARNVGEDADFFKAIHNELDVEFIKYPIQRSDRFFLMRGRSQYTHMSIGGGEKPLDTAPGRYEVSPTEIQDLVLRNAFEKLILTRWEANQTEVFIRDETPCAPVLSVCICIKNRSRMEFEGGERQLFPRCVEALAVVADSLRELGVVELVVADFHSKDWPLTEWIKNKAGNLAVQLIAVNGEFSRGRGLNIAAAHSRSENLFICDADMLVSQSVVRQGLQIVESGKAYFPIVRLRTQAGELGGWQDFGLGISFISKQAFRQSGGFPEFLSWGGEDDIFRERIAQGKSIVRERAEGLEHQWHPDSCRFEHYVNPTKSDYRVFRRHEQLGKCRSQLFKKFLGNHPYWSGEVHLFTNGRMERPGIDAGNFELREEQELTLFWDDWPPEVLVWDETRRIYRCVSKCFTLEEVNTGGQAWRLSQPQIPCHPIDRHQIIYVEIPKAGCTSIKHALAPFQLGREWTSADLEALHRAFKYTRLSDPRQLTQCFRNRWSNYVKFTVVRHPIRRFESLYYQKIDPQCQWDINDYVYGLNESNHWLSDTHGAPQVSLIGKDLSAFDFVGRTEDMHGVEQFLNSILGKVHLPHLYKTTNKRSTLTHEAKKKLFQIYKEDFEVLGYAVDEERSECLK